MSRRRNPTANTGGNTGGNAGARTVIQNPKSKIQNRIQNRIIVGLSGGIACYKVAHVVSRLAQDGAEVTVAMTEAATHFITPLTFQALSARPVYTDQWQHIESNDPQHISL